MEQLDTIADQIKEKLKNVIDQMDEEWQESWELHMDDIVTGYVRWVNIYKCNKGLNPDITVEKLWEKYIAQYWEDEESAMFVQIFQLVQLKTYSEAIAETVGSVMTLAQARFRNLEPVNFAKEIFLRFNLPALHILKQSFISSIVEKLLQRKEFHRRLEKSRPDMLKFPNISASVGNFRALEEESSRMPIKSFMCNE